MEKFDFNKARNGAKLRSSLGCEARIVCWNRKGDYPIVALIESADRKEEIARYYDMDGKGQDGSYLYIDPNRIEVWVNLYIDDNCDITTDRVIYKTEQQAKDNAQLRDGYDVLQAKAFWEDK